MSDWYCPHGVGGPDARRGDCEACEAELAARPDPETMTGDERAAEVIALYGPNGYRVEGSIWPRIERLVGRPVWDRELAYMDDLVEEARTRKHPAFATVIDRIRQSTGASEVILAAVPTHGDTA